MATGDDPGPFAGLLRELRSARSLSQEELAERAGLTAKAVGALERGERRRPYPHTIRSLTEALALGPEEGAALAAAARGIPGAALRPSLPTTPGPATPLVGRDDEISQVMQLLQDGRRLVTLTGPGGVGKTRVALAVADRLGPLLPGGCVVVELADVRDPAAVIPTVASALGIPEAAGPMTTAAAVTPHVAGRRLLVVVDNLEQVLAGAPDLAELVERSPDLLVVATSRAALRVRTEHEVPLAPLALPAGDTVEEVGDSESARVVLDRAAAAGVPLELTTESAPVIAAICRGLDGLPLALELAAAALRLLDPAALLARLGRPVGSGLRDLPERQRTMASALDWSLDLLTEEQRSLFGVLGVFPGGFSIEAFAAVAGEDRLVDLEGLVDHSLVVRTPSGRFRMLEPVRQHAAERLRNEDPDAVAAQAHAAYFQHAATALRNGLMGSGLAAALDEVEADHPNHRVAFERLMHTGRPEAAAEMARSLWLGLAVRGHAWEGLDWLRRLDLAAASAAARRDRAVALAGLLMATGQTEAMHAAAEEAVGWATASGDDRARAEALVLAGMAAVALGELDVAEANLREGRALAERVGERVFVVSALMGLGQRALMAGDPAGAEEVLVDGVASGREVGNAFMLAAVINVLALATSLQGDLVRTADLLAEATELSLVTRIGWSLAYSLPALAGLALQVGEPALAATLFGASATMTTAYAVDRAFPMSVEMEAADLRAAREALDEEAFRTAWEKGRHAGTERLLDLAEEVRRRAQAPRSRRA